MVPIRYPYAGNGWWRCGKAALLARLFSGTALRCWKRGARRRPPTDIQHNFCFYLMRKQLSVKRQLVRLNGRSRRSLDELVADEMSRLCLLNEKLIATEAWIHERTQQCLTAYYMAGGVKNHRLDKGVIENIEVDAKVTCILRCNHPEFREGSDNVVATLDALTQSVELCDAEFTFAEFGAAGEVPPLAGIRLCWLFHHLVDHVLKLDWDRALAIGEIWIDVQLVQQRMVTW
jgi:hypothetical protein